ncbi:MAG: glycosyltransferase [Bacteroidetes bacterium]|nr:glycosyltransferase [Bacteroidota bacterium]
MRILILNADYTAFLRWLYASQPGLAAARYDEQMAARNASLFGVADFYSWNLRSLGHEAWEIHANNEPMQRAWACENGLALPENSGRRWRMRLRGGLVPWLSRVEDRRWMYRVLAEQIRRLKPDVLLNQALDGIDPRFIREMRPHVRLLAGQVAAPLGDDGVIREYDLILSSLPGFLERARALGARGELHRFAFDARVLDLLPAVERDLEATFVGSISRHHESRVALLERVARTCRLQLWGKGIETLPEDSPLRSIHNGEAWGRGMYDILNRSRMTLNHHIGIAGAHANNMRLFEATGSGAMLITDWKSNLHEMFEPGREVIAYRDHEECARMIEYYAAHHDEREAIARAGRERTLRDHNYRVRMEELAGVLERYLANAGGSVR